MSSLMTAGILFGCVSLGTFLALWLSRRLPEAHLTGDSRDVVKQGLGVIGTLTALVLGLLVASTKGTYDAQSGTIKEVAAQFALMDRVLARYGPETREAREELRNLAQAVLDQFWPQSGPIQLTGGASRQIGEAFFDRVAALEPKTEAQRLLKSRALETTVGLAQLRQRLVVNSDRTLPTSLLVLLAFWQTTLFAGFGLLAPRNATAMIVLCICMLASCSALFVVLELDRPFEGMIRISDAPIRTVLSHLGE